MCHGDCCCYGGFLRNTGGHEFHLLPPFRNPVSDYRLWRGHYRWLGKSARDLRRRACLGNLSTVRGAYSRAWLPTSEWLYNPAYCFDNKTSGSIRKQIGILMRSKAIRLILMVLVLVFLATVPAWGSRYIVNVGLLMCVYVTLASMWNLLAGFSGMVSLGQQMFIVSVFFIGSLTSVIK